MSRAIATLSTICVQPSALTPHLSLSTLVRVRAFRLVRAPYALSLALCPFFAFSVSPAAPAPAPMQQSGGGGGMLGGMMGMVGQGLAFGTGSAIAHRAVDAVVGPRTVTHEHVGAADAAPAPAPAAAPAVTSASADSCTYHSKAFADCVQANGTDIAKCQFYIDMLNDCKKQHGLSA
ncbi:unnamed protein product [Closterium sp. NIES-53]